MYFQNLDKERDAKLIEFVKKLSGDKEFSKILTNDEVLDDLDEERFDIKKSFIGLQAMQNYPMKYKNVMIKQITLNAWTNLWCLENPLVMQGKEIEEEDIDLFLYILNNGVGDDILKTAEKAYGCMRKMNLSMDDGITISKMLISLAFFPLRMLPKNTNDVGGTMPIYDAEWVASMITKVNNVTGLKPNEILNDLSLNACCHYYIQYCKMQGVQGIEKMQDGEIIKAEFERTTDLLIDYAIENKVIDGDKKEFYAKLLKTPPEK